MTNGKSITPEQAYKMIDLLMTLDSKELGIFISMVSQRYIKDHTMTKEQFMTSLSNSIDKLENGEQ